MVILLFYTAIFSGSLSCYNLCRLAISPDNLGWKLSQKVSDPICSSKQCQLSYLSKIFQSGLVNLQGQRLRELFRQPTPSPNSPHVETVSLSIQSEPLWFQNMSLAPCHPTMHQSPVFLWGDWQKIILFLPTSPQVLERQLTGHPSQSHPFSKPSSLSISSTGRCPFCIGGSLLNSLRYQCLSHPRGQKTGHRALDAFQQVLSQRLSSSPPPQYLYSHLYSLSAARAHCCPCLQFVAHQYPQVLFTKSCCTVIQSIPILYCSG